MIVKNKCKSLYAPWREEYVSKVSEDKEKTKDPNFCPFCKIEKELQILETKKCFIQANKYPYSAGHLLVIPKRHINQITELTSIERKELFNLIDLSIYSLDILIKPEGYNVGCSIGRIAGESINHLHFHVLPRFKGDVGWNRICDFNVISISPKDLTTQLKQTIQKNKIIKKFLL